MSALNRSFAYPTVTERLPVIVTTIIDTLVREKNELVSKHLYVIEG